jgi:hypothetical protein
MVAEHAQTFKENRKLSSVFCGNLDIAFVNSECKNKGSGKRFPIKTIPPA